MYKENCIKIVFLLLNSVLLGLNAYAADAMTDGSYVKIFAGMGYKQIRRDFESSPFQPSCNDMDHQLNKILVGPDPWLADIELRDDNSGSFSCCKRKKRDAAPSISSKSVNEEIRNLASEHGFEVIGSRQDYVRDYVPWAADKILACETILESPFWWVRNGFDQFYRHGFWPSAMQNRRVDRPYGGAFCYGSAVTCYLQNKAFYDKVSSCVRGNSENVRKTVGLYDGGNILTLTNRSGQKKVLLGESAITLNHMMLQKEGFFESDPEAAAWINSRVADENCSWAYEEKYRDILVKTKELREIKPPQFAIRDSKEPELLEDAEKIARIFFAQRDYVKEVIIPRDMGVGDILDVVYVTQLDYHLDIFLAPGPGGSVLVKDLDKSVELLENMIAENRAPVRSLNSILKKTQETANELRTITRMVVDEVTAAGFDVIRAPSTFISATKGDYPVDFLNPIYGKSATGYFWATLDPLPLKDKGSNQVLDELKIAWMVFLKHFVFHNLELDATYLEGNNKSMADSSAGVHCLFAEIPL